MLKPERPRKFWRHLPWLAALLLGLAETSQAAETALDRYVAKLDPNYTYKTYLTKQETGYTAYFLEMTSQQWRSVAEVDRPIWQHEMVVVIPQFGLDSSDTAILLIDGGSNGGTPLTDVPEAIGAAAIATGAVIASVRQVPNQPLYFTDDPERGRKEDAILGYSLDKALDTGDPEWAAHLAMTKAAVRAMDTVQTFAASKGKTVNDFLVLGGSKRGWTTWLTAAVDKRVKAIVPISIDMLNLGRQFIHHWEAYGFFAPALKDYVEFDLPCRLQTPQGQDLLRVVDPYAYRDRYTMPKLILSSTGDQFFVTDSSRFYYGDLPGPKWLRYTPNTDHTESTDTAVDALSWLDDILDNKTSPQITWTREGDDTIRISPTSQPKQVRLWQATNPNARDFRLETLGPVWTSEVLTPAADGTYVGRVQLPATGWKAFFIDATFPTAGVIEPDQVYSTEVQIIPDTLPYAGTACGGSKSNLESPQQSSAESGIGLIRGWICDANTVEVQIDSGARERVAYGTTREDTAAVCGDTNNGFGYTVNWNRIGNGNHTLRAFADGAQFASATFNVTTLGVEYLQGASGEYPLPNFPQAGDSVTVRWSEPHQNFVIVGASRNPASAQSTSFVPLATGSLANLESPYPGSFESGVGLIRGWICDANTVEVQIDNGARERVAYGTTREDTATACGDTNNGFGYTVNWNKLGNGSHTLKAFADNVEFGNATFTVTTLGVEYLQGASGEYPLPNFPQAGHNVTVRWSEPHQNFVIMGYQ